MKIRSFLLEKGAGKVRFSLQPQFTCVFSTHNLQLSARIPTITEQPVSTIARISHLKEYVGQEVTLQGWLYNKTDKGKLQFLQLRDGSGIAQAVIFKGNVSEDAFKRASA